MSGQKAERSHAGRRSSRQAFAVTFFSFLLFVCTLYIVTDALFGITQDLGWLVDAIFHR